MLIFYPEKLKILVPSRYIASNCSQAVFINPRNK